MSDTLLGQLRQMTVIVADSGDVDSILRFHPQDSTTNPSLIATAAALPQYRPLVDKVLMRARKDAGGSATDQDIANLAFRRLAVAFGTGILGRIPGRVSTEVDARLSFDKEATLSQAYDIIAQYEASGVSRSRVLIKIAATWQGIQAARQLEKNGIHCNLTLIFSLHQAAACADANVTLISPFVGRILDWHKRDGKTPTEDPGVQAVTVIYSYLKQYGYRTEVMGASFRNVGEILQLAGCDLLTISPALLAELDATMGEVPRRLNADAARSTLIPRMSLDQEEFERLHACDQMATDLLTAGIDGFSKSLATLETLLADRLSELGASSHLAQAAESQ